MSIKALSDYTQYSKYAKYDKEKKRRETWYEQVDRVFKMHEDKLGDKLELIKNEFDFAKDMVRRKRVLGSQRALQFGGKPILTKQAKLYNCTVSYVDRPRFFQECMYLLLCGCGTGFSVQKHHIAKLPNIRPRDKGEKLFVVPDSIEGWSDCIGILMASYFDADDEYFCYDYNAVIGDYSGYKINFDFSEIRPKGAPISWGGKAPGPEGLKASVEKIEELLDEITSNGIEKLDPIHAYDIIMHASDAVLSGGVRRSATICLFSPDDDEMATAKTGNWHQVNPQRARSNNSAILIRDETTKEQFSKLMESVKEFGEPGFVWAEDKELLVNPCVEIGMRAYTDDGESGWQFCNLCEMNMKKVKCEEDFLKACHAAAILGTIQASYDQFDYLTEATMKIVRKEALLGVSMTGMMDSPEIAFDPKIQRRGAKEILDVNERISEILGINKCARATCVKPAGSTSCVLGTASGIHPHHAKRYFRRVQANELEFPLQHFMSKNPAAVEKSVWDKNKNDYVINFLCEVPDGAKTKNQVNALDLLEHVKLTQQNWVQAGTRKDAPVADWLRHNVSNTINVKPDEWDDVENYIYKNRKWFAGVSLLPHSGDMDYPQSPFATVLNEKELVQEYGEGTVFASGLIVDGQHAFDGNLWKACDCALGIGEKLKTCILPDEPQMPAKNGYTAKQWAHKLAEYAVSFEQYQEDKEAYDVCIKKQDWVRRFNQFADRYCSGNKRKCTHMLKHVSLWKQWLDLKREYVDIDWSEVVEEEEYEIDVGSLAGGACAGKNGCDISSDLAAKIDEQTKRHKKVDGDTEPTSAA
jgi:ribonucleoside-diphosphate reductase alpha chain